MCSSMFGIIDDRNCSAVSATAATTSEKLPAITSGTENETEADESSGSRWTISSDSIVLIDFAMTSTFSRWIWPRIGSLARATASTASEKNSRVARSYSSRARNGPGFVTNRMPGSDAVGTAPVTYVGASDVLIVVQRMPSDSSTAGRTPLDAAGDNQTSASSSCAAAVASVFKRLSWVWRPATLAMTGTRDLGSGRSMSSRSSRRLRIACSCCGAGSRSNGPESCPLAPATAARQAR